MKKEQFTKLGFTEDMAQKALEVFREELRGYIPKTRFDQVNEIKKELEQKLSLLEAQFTELNSITFTCQELEKILKNLWSGNAALKARQEEMMKDILIQTAIRSRLVDVRYAGLLTGKFDKSKLTVASDGTVSGIEEQLEEMKVSYEGLFRI